MESLRFKIKGQILQKDSSSNFRNLVAGSSNIYNAEFAFDENWIGYKAVAVFAAGEIIETIPIIAGGVAIPSDILAYNKFTVKVLGQNGDRFLPTTEVTVRQIGGKK